MELAFWIPLLLIFLSGLLAAILKRHARDHCLKPFRGSFVLVKLKSGKWIWGDLAVYANCLEIQFREPSSLAGRHDKLSYVLYEHHLPQIERILRPSPRLGTEEYAEWLTEVRRLQNPSLLRRLRRAFRNGFNFVRDAFNQSIGFFLGAARQKTRLGRVPVAADERIGEMSRTLMSAIPNSYEPVLERYLGREVIVEMASGDRMDEVAGTLQEYSGQYLLVRDISWADDFPAEALAEFSGRFDVVFPRGTNLVRHLSRRSGIVSREELGDGAEAWDRRERAPRRRGGPAAKIIVGDLGRGKFHGKTGESPIVRRRTGD